VTASSVAPIPWYSSGVPHPVTKPDILAALESNARTIHEYFSELPDPVFFDGDPERWGPAHHLVHLTRSNDAVSRALVAGNLPLHPAGRSRTYAEVRDAATASLTTTPKEALLEMGSTVVVEPGTGRVEVVEAFATSSAGLREAAAIAIWSEDALDRHALRHPLIGVLTVREMLFFGVVHERHHLRTVQTRFGARR
jgi:hypothetical protein